MNPASRARLKRKEPRDSSNPHGYDGKWARISSRKGRTILRVWCICIYLALINGGREEGKQLRARTKSRSKLRKINQFNLLPSMKVFPHRKPVRFYEQTTDSFGTDTLNERQRIRAKLYFSRFVSRIYIMAARAPPSKSIFAYAGHVT